MEPHPHHPTAGLKEGHPLKLPDGVMLEPAHYMAPPTQRRIAILAPAPEGSSGASPPEGSHGQSSMGSIEEADERRPDPDGASTASVASQSMSAAAAAAGSWPVPSPAPSLAPSLAPSAAASVEALVGAPTLVLDARGAHTPSGSLTRFSDLMRLCVDIHSRFVVRSPEYVCGHPSDEEADKVVSSVERSMAARGGPSAAGGLAGAVAGAAAGAVSGGVAAGSVGNFPAAPAGSVAVGSARSGGDDSSILLTYAVASLSAPRLS